MTLTGGCACRKIRYQVEIGPGDPADYCHCRQCRQATGAPVAAWVQVPPERFRLTRGNPAGYPSSPGITRWFCATCGSPLHMTDEAGKSVGILLGSLDEPEAVPPTAHGWASARIAWFDTRDELPRHAESPPWDVG
jgi:hypothetical protein